MDIPKSYNLTSANLLEYLQVLYIPLKFTFIISKGNHLKVNTQRYKFRNFTTSKNNNLIMLNIWIYTTNLVLYAIRDLILYI